MRLKLNLCWVALILGAGVTWADGGANTAEWRSLFNGKDLSGWVKVNDSVFTATNGVIRLDGGKGWLRTEKQFTNFVFEAECRGLETNYNSGIFIRAPLDGKPWATNVWQVNLKQSAIGELLEGSIKIVPPKLPMKPIGEWIKLQIAVRGRSMSLRVDGQNVWDFKELTPTHGFIGLQAEGKTMEFRNLRISELTGIEVP